MHRIVRRHVVKPTQQTTAPPQTVAHAEQLQKPKGSAAYGIRVTTVNNAAARAIKAEGARNDLNHLLKSISQNDRDIDDAVTRNEEAYRKIEEILRDNNFTSHTDGVYLAEIAEQFTRQTRIIDPKKFRAFVVSDAFWKCVKIGLEDAKQFLTDAEINKIADVIPAKSNGHIFKIKRLPRQSKR